MSIPYFALNYVLQIFTRKFVVFRWHAHTAVPASTGLSVSAKCGTATVNK